MGPSFSSIEIINVTQIAIGGNLSGQNDVVKTVNQYCPGGDTVRFGQSSLFFANPVSFGAKHTS